MQPNNNHYSVNINGLTQQLQHLSTQGEIVANQRQPAAVLTASNQLDMGQHALLQRQQ